MDHYYSEKPSSKSQRKKIEVKINSLDLTLLTDAGVFSKKRIDKGSKVLIKAAQETKFPTGNILDMGCGYGVVGISLAKTFPNRVVEMVDINERAINLS
ncbi:MAG: methyltransferase, partial [Atopostipes sp.]|nr:methyltransferase [Atopostipes sp.]